MDAGLLWPGAHVREANGQYGVVGAVTVVPHPQTMYNLTVAQAHTFFVGNGQWLVHNTCSGLGTNPSLPFKDSALNDQIERVVKSMDATNAPPPGVRQGGATMFGTKLTGLYRGGGLPDAPLGYYTETDIWPSEPGTPPGVYRLIFGKDGEVYATIAHYADGAWVRIR